MSGGFIGIVFALMLVGLYTVLVCIFSAGSRKKRAEAIKTFFTEYNRVNEILVGELRRSNEHLSRIVAAVEKKDSIH